MTTTPIYFKYKNHPGDLLRDDSVQRLPNFNTEKEDFRVWFHPDYSGSETVAYLNDLYKWLDEKLDEEEEQKFLQYYGAMTKEEIEVEIERTEAVLDLESLEGFWRMVEIGKVLIYS